jgi:hypothetical protein
MRSLMAVIAGAVTSFLMMAVIAFLMMTLDIKPFSDFGTGKVTQAQFIFVAQKILFLYFVIILPFIGLVTGLVAALIARHKEYMIGLLHFPHVNCFF